MQIGEINELANDILVAKNLAELAQNKIDKIVFEHPEIIGLQDQIVGLKADRTQKQATLLEIMREANLKQWKTETASFSRAKRSTARPVAGFDKIMKEALIAGEKVKGWELRETEYMSIRATKPKK